jgi:uncharacterized protein (TIGR02996 family)
MPVAPLSPPRPELLALLDAVKDHPDDDTPRLVLADWLDEQDNSLDAERAKFIRADIGKYRSRRRAKPTGKLDHEGKALAERWLGPLVSRTGITVQFERGLPRLRITGQRFLEPEFLSFLATEAFAFVDFVATKEAEAYHMTQIAAKPELRYVTGLGTMPFYPFGVSDSQKIFGSPNLTGLRQLVCNHTNLGVGGTQAIVNNPALAQLRKLSIIYNRLIDSAVIALAASPHLANLQSLCLVNNSIGDKGAEALANSPHLTNLRELDLTKNPPLTKTGKKRLRDKFGDRVKV